MDRPLVAFELAGLAASPCGFGSGLITAETAGDLAASLVGKIWSAKFFARKPGT